MFRNLCPHTAVQALTLAVFLLGSAGCDQGSSGGPRHAGATTTLFGLKSWATAYGGSKGDRALDIQTTAEGGYIVAGETESYGGGEKDAWVMKQDEDGNVSWSRAYGDGNLAISKDAEPSLYDNEAVATHHLVLLSTEDGGCVVAGAVFDRFPDTSRDPDQRLPIFQPAATKLDAAGRTEWRSTYTGGDRGGRILAMDRTSGGGYILAGYLEKEGLNADDRNRDVLYIRINAAGAELWRITAGLIPHEVVTAIQVTPDGDFIVARMQPEGDGGNLAILSKLRPHPLDRGFELIWDRTYTDEKGLNVYSVRRSTDGSSWTFAGAVKEEPRYEYGGNDQGFNVWAANLRDSDGEEQWQETIEANGDFTSAGDMAFSIDTTPGGCLIAGYSGVLSRDGMLLQLNGDGDISGGRNFGGQDLPDEFHAVRRLPDGFLVAGSKGILSEGNNGTYQKSDIWVIKLDNNLSTVWDRTYDLGRNLLGSKYRAYSVDQAADASGYLIAGGGNQGGWAMKVDRDGNEVWHKATFDLTHDSAASVQQTDDDGDGERDDGFIVAGYTQSISRESRDAWLIKLDPAGAIQWQKTFGRDRDDEANSVQVTPQGEFLVAGRTQVGFSDFRAWVFLIDPQGGMLWERIFERGEASSAAFCAFAGADGFHWIAGTLNQSAFVLKLDPNGAPAPGWESPRTFSGKTARSITGLDGGGCAVAGSLRKALGEEADFRSADDFWAARLDAAGAIVAEKTFGGRQGEDEEEQATGIAASGAGLAVAGWTRSFGGGQDCKSDEDRLRPCANFWVLQLSLDLEVIWQRTYSSAVEDLAFAVRAVPGGGWIVAGETGAYQGPPDAWILKLKDDGLVSDFCPGDSIGEETRCTIELQDGGFFPAPFDGNEPAAAVETASNLRQFEASGLFIDTLCYEQYIFHKLSIAKVGLGTVTGTPEGIDCGASCSANFKEGTTVSLTAAPDEGWEFTGWSANCPGGVVRMDIDQVCTASFRKLEEPIDPGEGGGWAGYWEDTYDCSQRCGEGAPEPVSGVVQMLIELDGNNVTIENFTENINYTGTLDRNNTITWTGTATLDDGRIITESGTFTLLPGGRTFTKTSAYSITGSPAQGIPPCTAACTGNGRKIAG